jgi:hypothetical protein
MPPTVKKQRGSGTEIIIRIHQKRLFPDSMNTDLDQSLFFIFVKTLFYIPTVVSYVVKTHLHNYFLTFYFHALNFYHNVYIAVHTINKIQYVMYPNIKIISIKILRILFLPNSLHFLFESPPLFFPLFPQNTTFFPLRSSSTLQKKIK